MFFRLRLGAPLLFWMIVMMAVTIGVQQGYAADSAGDATVKINTTNATENISTADVEGDGFSAATERATLNYAKSQVEIGMVTAEAVANRVGPFIYAHQGWLRPWILKPLISIITLAPVLWAMGTVLGRVRNAVR